MKAAQREPGAGSREWGVQRALRLAAVATLRGVHYPATLLNMANKCLVNQLHTKAKVLTAQRGETLLRYSEVSFGYFHIICCGINLTGK